MFFPRDRSKEGIFLMAEVKKHEIDMLHGPIWNKLPLFALPVAATAILEQLFNASDLAIVGNFTGEASTLAVAAVGANSPIIGLIVNLFIGIALGANVVIATAIGCGDDDAVRRAVHTSIVFSVLGGTLVALLGQLAAAPLLSVLNVPDDVFPYALLYLRIYLLGMPVILLYNFEAAIFRSVGDTKGPLAALALSGVLNVLLNLFFVIALHMTVGGVAIATVTANAVSAILLYLRLTRTNKCVRVERRALRIDRTSLKRILSIGLPAGVQSAVFSFANIVIQSAINSLGTLVIAASSAAFSIEILAYDVLNSFSQACTTFVGQNYGAGQIRRCRKTMLLSLLEDAAATFLAVTLVLLSARTLLAFFNSDPAVIDLGYLRLSVILPAYAFSLVYEILSGYLRGFGISLVPAVLTMLGVCGIRIAWVKFVFPQNMTCGKALFADAVGNGGGKQRRQVQVVAHHILPDIPRGGVGRVGDHAAHRLGKAHSRGHEHGRRAHGNAREIDGQVAPAVVHDPAHPAEAVVALGEAKADISALALVLRALLHIEHTALFPLPELREQAEIPIPRRAPAVKGDEDALGVFNLAEMAHERQPLAAAQQHRLRVRGAELLRRLALRRAIALILALPRQV